MSMKAQIIEDAQVLIPNSSHRNFTRTNEIIKQGTVVEGNPKIVKGLKRGEAFDYKLFQIDEPKANKDQIIFIKYIKPMEKTEVTLGADAQQSPTKVQLPSVSNLGWRPIACAAAGAGIGFYLAKKRKWEGYHKMFAIVGGGAIGFVAGKFWQSKRPVKIQASK